MPGYPETGCYFFRRGASSANLDVGNQGISGMRFADCDLVVYPAAYMPIYAKRSGAKIVIINMGDTGHDDIADVFINAPAGDTMTRIMEKLRSRIRE